MTSSKVFEASVPEVVQSMIKAWASGDLDATMACYSETNLEVYDAAVNHKFKTHTEARGFVADTFSKWTDCTYKTSSVTGSANTGVVIEGHFSVTARSDATKPMAAAGETVELPGVTLLRFDPAGGKIVSQHDYYCIPLGKLVGDAAFLQ